MSRAGTRVPGGGTRPVWAFAFMGALLMILPVVAVGQPADALLYVGDRFAIEQGAGGVERLLIHDENGQPARSVSLENHTVQIGPDGLYALLARDADPQGRLVELFDAAGAELASFRLGADRMLTLGAAALAVYPRAEHAVGVAYELEFRRLDGSLLASHERRTVRLVDLALQQDGFWLATGVGEDGAHRVQLYDPAGGLRWERPLADRSMPIVALSAGGARVAIGTLRDDLVTSSLALVDGGGAGVVTRVVPAFRLAVFSPDASRLLLVGTSGLQLLDAQTGATVWSTNDKTPLPAGPAAVFAVDGTRFFIISQEEHFGRRPDRVWLRAYSNLGGAITRSVRPLDELPHDDRLAVLDLRSLPDGRLRLTTQIGIRLLSP